MAKRDKVSIAVIRRLPRYYRFLGILESHGIGRISSRDLADKMSVNASQIRQDFNCFGEFGQQGYGYAVSQLRQATSDILGIGNRYKMVIIGAGNLGRAIITRLEFEKFGFSLIGVFDNSPQKIGTFINGHQVLDVNGLEAFCKKEQQVMATLCMPGSEAAGLVKVLYEAGIKNYWNFTHHDIAMDYSDVIVENVHLNDSLMTLCYRITHANDNRDDI